MGRDVQFEKGHYHLRICVFTAVLKELFSEILSCALSSRARLLSAHSWPRRFRNPLIQEYTSNCHQNPDMIQGLFLHSGHLEALGPLSTAPWP